MRAGVRSRRDKREQCATVGRGHGHPPFTGLKLRIEGQGESEFVHVESQALILVLDVNVDGVNTKVRPTGVKVTGPV